jgi:hypothetical protein
MTKTMMAAAGLIVTFLATPVLAAEGPSVRA